MACSSAEELSTVNRAVAGSNPATPVGRFAATIPTLLCSVWFAKGIRPLVRVPALRKHRAGLPARAGDPFGKRKRQTRPSLCASLRRLTLGPSLTPLKPIPGRRTMLKQRGHCRHSSVVEHTLGKGEVVSSNLTGGSRSLGAAVAQHLDMVEATGSIPVATIAREGDNPVRTRVRLPLAPLPGATRLSTGWRVPA